MENKNGQPKKIVIKLGHIYLFLIGITFGILFFMSGLNQAKSVFNDTNGFEDVTSTKVYEAKILGTEAIGSSSNVDYNTYFELKDGVILKLNNDNVYAYAKFNEGVSVKVEVKEGLLETDAKDIYGNNINTVDEKEGVANITDTKKVYKDRFMYISDVLVNEKSIKYL